MATLVKLRVIKVDSHDEIAGIKVGDVVDAFLAFNHGTHYYLVDTPTKKGHHLLKDQVESVDKNKL